MGRYERVELEYDIDNARQKLFSKFKDILDIKKIPVPPKINLEFKVTKDSSLINHLTNQRLIN
jgi:hypothetical protein